MTTPPPIPTTTTPPPLPPPVGAVPVEPLPVEPVEATAADAVPPAVAVPRFCNACGAPWAAEWLACPHCAGRSPAAREREYSAIETRNTPVTSAIALYFTFLAASVVMIVAGLAGANSVTTDFVVSGGISLVIAVWCVVFRREIVPALRRTGNLLWYPAAAGAAVVTFVLASAAVFGLGHLLGIPQLRYSDDFFHQGYGVGTVILMVAVQPAIFEELAFRGVILAGVQHVLSPMESVVVSALMFMIIHLAVPSFPHLFVLGLALGWLRVHTGSLYPGMLLHFTHNLLCIVFEVWRPSLLPW